MGIDINSEIRTGEDIAREAQKRFAVTIHKSLHNEIEALIRQEAVTPDDMMEVIGQAAGFVAESGRKWRENIATSNWLNRRVVAVCAAGMKIKRRDVIVTAGNGDGEFKAFLQKEQSSDRKLLGSDINLENLKKRIDQFYVNAAVILHVRKRLQDCGVTMHPQYAPENRQPIMSKQMVTNQGRGYGD